MADILCAGCARFLQHAVDELDGVTCIFTSPSHTPRIGDPTRFCFPSISPSAHSPGHCLPLEDDARNGVLY
jgi:hypothetical protein